MLYICVDYIHPYRMCDACSRWLTNRSPKKKKKTLQYVIFMKIISLLFWFSLKKGLHSSHCAQNWGTTDISVWTFILLHLYYFFKNNASFSTAVPMTFSSTHQFLLVCVCVRLVDISALIVMSSSSSQP